MKPEISVITVLYGSPELVIDSTKSWITGSNKNQVQHIFLDNSPEPLRTGNSEFDGILKQLNSVYEHCPINLGFAEGSNYAVRNAKADWLLFLNPDVSLANDSISRILEQIRSGQADCYSISMKVADEVYQGIECNKFGFFSDRRHSSRRPLIGPSGGAMAIRASLFEETGGFDGTYFAWGEDSAFALRIAADGHKTATIDLKLDHIGGHSVSNAEIKKLKNYLLTRNRIWLIRDSFSSVAIPVYLAVILPAIFANILLRKISSGVGVPAIRGLIHGLFKPRPKSSKHHSLGVDVLLRLFKGGNPF